MKSLSDPELRVADEIAGAIADVTRERVAKERGQK
jgi:hypothetical protein